MTGQEQQEAVAKHGSDEEKIYGAILSDLEGDRCDDILSPRTTFVR
jgi:hypothetical protein